MFRSLVQGLTVVATQTNIESEAHQAMANVLLNKISVPMKNLAETQMKSRKPVRRKKFDRIKIKLFVDLDRRCFEHEI